MTQKEIDQEFGREAIYIGQEWRFRTYRHVIVKVANFMNDKVCIDDESVFHHGWMSVNELRKYYEQVTPELI